MIPPRAKVAVPLMPHATEGVWMEPYATTKYTSAATPANGTTIRVDTVARSVATR